MLVRSPPRTAARDQSAQVREATAHFFPFEPFGLAIEPFRVRGLLLRVQEEFRKLSQAQELQSLGSAIQEWVAMRLVWRLLLGAYLDSNA